MKLLQQLLILGSLTVTSFIYADTNMARNAYNQKNYTEAINQASASISMNNRDSSAYNILFMSYKATGQTVKYLNALKQYISLNNIVDKKELSTATYKAFASHNYPLCIFFTQVSNNLDSTDSSNLNLMGVSFYNLKKYNLSIAAFEFAIRNNPNPAFYANLGRSYVALEDKTNAILNYKKALKLNPNYKKAQIELAKILGTYKKPQAPQRTGKTMNNAGQVQQSQYINNHNPVKQQIPAVKTITPSVNRSTPLPSPIPKTISPSTNTSSSSATQSSTTTPILKSNTNTQNELANSAKKSETKAENNPLSY